MSMALKILVVKTEHVDSTCISKPPLTQPIKLSALTEPFLGQEGKAISSCREKEMCLIDKVCLYLC